MSNKYDNYKDSGIEWIGEIPSHWEYSPVKYFTEIINGSTPSSSEESYWNGDINWVTTDDLGKLNQKYILSTRRTITETGYKSCGTTIAPKGSVVISSRAPIGHLGILKIDACTNQGCKTLIPKNINSEFLHYYLGIGRNELEALGQGSTFKELPTSALKGFKLISPPISEQTAIANYLDHKTTQIEHLIAKKEQLIQLLEEERVAVINQAVTKGLDPTVPMKESGIEWLEEIPVHWEVKRIKHLLSEPLKYGANESAEEENLDDPRYIRITDFGNDGKLKANTFKSLPFSKAENFLLSEGDILFARSGATVGKTFFFNNYKGIACFAGYLIKASCDRQLLIPEFLYEFTNTGSYNNWKQSIFQQSTIQNIGADKYNQLKIAIPPISEQKAIVEFLKNKSNEIVLIITKTQQEIELLKEYKTALISEVVTGKVDVSTSSTQVLETKN